MSQYLLDHHCLWTNKPHNIWRYTSCVEFSPSLGLPLCSWCDPSDGQVVIYNWSLHSELVVVNHIGRCSSERCVIIWQDIVPIHHPLLSNISCSWQSSLCTTGIFQLCHCPWGNTCNGSEVRHRQPSEKSLENLLQNTASLSVRISVGGYHP